MENICIYILVFWQRDSSISSCYVRRSQIYQGRVHPLYRYHADGTLFTVHRILDENTDLNTFTPRDTADVIARTFRQIEAYTFICIYIAMTARIYTIYTLIFLGIEALTLDMIEGIVSVEKEKRPFVLSYSHVATHGTLRCVFVYFTGYVEGKVYVCRGLYAYTYA